MGHPLLLGITEFLKDGAQCVCDIADHVQPEISNVSSHLSVLERAGIVSDHRAGLKIMCSLIMPCIMDFTTCVEVAMIQKSERRCSATTI